MNEKSDKSTVRISLLQDTRQIGVSERVELMVWTTSGTCAEKRVLGVDFEVDNHLSEPICESKIQNEREKAIECQ